MLPDKIALRTLESQCPRYAEKLDVWREISDLREGTTALLRKKDVYIPRRPGEPDDIYRLRLDKMVYTPVFSNAVREFCAKLASAPVHLTGTDNPFWSDFLEHIDGKNQDQSELLHDIFACLLYFGKIYLAVDKPFTGVNPRSRAEDPDAKPYGILYEPLMVPREGSNWYMTRQLNTSTDPVGETEYKYLWTFWDETHITRYEAQVQIGDNGEILKVLSGGRWVSPHLKGLMVDRVSTLEHGMGTVPIVSLELPVEMWTGSNVYRKQLQYLWVENGWTEAGTLAGVVQRIFKPSPPKPVEDVRVIHQSIPDEDIQKIKTGNPYILIGDGFEFVESTGNALSNLQGMLDKIEHQIRTLVSMGYMSASDRGSIQQSGLSKEFDQALLLDTMRSYGKKVSRLYQDFLGLVARAIGQTEEPDVKGLDTYNTNNLSGMVELTGTLRDYLEYLPNTAQKVWFGKLANMLTGSVSKMEAQAIREELDQLFSDRPLDPDNPADIQALADTLGLTLEEAQRILGG